MSIPNFKTDLVAGLKKLAGVHAIGELWWHFDPNAKPAGVQLFAGQTLSRASYEAHWELVSTKRKVVSETDWQECKQEWGFCPYYSSGDGSTTYRMPLIKDIHPEFVEALSKAGDYLSAGLPNITGDTGLNQATAASMMAPIGAFYNNGVSGKRPIYASVGTYSNGIAIDASLSNPIYGNSDTVQPPSLTFVLGEYVVGVIGEIGVSDKESLLASVTQLESEVGAFKNQTSYVVSETTTNAGWNRKWSSGFVEYYGRHIDHTNSIGAGKDVAWAILFNNEFTSIPHVDLSFGYDADKISASIPTGGPELHYDYSTLGSGRIQIKLVVYNRNSSTTLPAGWFIDYKISGFLKS